MTKETIVGRFKRGLSGLAVVTLGIALAAPAAFADKGDNHKGVQTFFGVSVSSIEFLLIAGKSYCYAGTAGALVEDAAGVFILSNNHVLARESSVEPGATGGLADYVAGEIDDPIIQPGLLDENGDGSSCSPASTDYSGYTVGHLIDWVPLKFDDGSASPPTNLVDAAIAAVDPGAGSPMDPDGRILDIGGLGPGIAPAVVGMAVQKSGRTTGHTTGSIGAVGVEVSVGYSNGTALFQDQIMVSGKKGAFIKSGDSGSLMVTNPGGTERPQAVGLLFAGSRLFAIANRIENVLSGLGVSMVGCTTDCSNTGVAGGGGGGDGGGGKKGGGPDCTANPNHKKCNAGNAGASNVIGLEVAAEVRDLHRNSLMGNPDVVGTGLSFDENGEPVIQVYTRGSRRSVNNPLPSELDGVKVQVIVTGEFEAF